VKSLVILSCLLLGSCALGRELPATAAGPLDSTLRAAGLTTGKVKFKGPVTLQIGGSGNVATTIAKAKAPVASAPHATATETTSRAPTPWYVFAGLVLAGAAGGAWLRGKFSFLSFFK